MDHSTTSAVTEEPMPQRWSNGDTPTSGPQHAMLMRAASFGSVRQVVDEAWYTDDPTLDDRNDDVDPAVVDADGHAVLVDLKKKIRASGGGERYDEVGLLEPILVRRRVHSSDVVLRSPAPAPNSFHRPRDGPDGPDSPTLALRQWLANSSATMSPAELRRQRQHRRTQSTELALTTSHLLRQSPSAIAEEMLHDDEHEDEPIDHQDDENGMDNQSDHEDGEVDNPSKATRPRRAGSEDSHGSESSFVSNPIARSYESAPHEDPPSVEKLLNLQKLYQEGFITVTEYKNRRLQLVDELTVSNSNKTINRTTDLIQTSLPVIHRDPPDFTVLRERDAIKHVFDSEKRKWTSSRIKVKIDPQPFARGGLRQVFHLQDLSVIPRLGPEGRPVSYVAKIAIDVDEDPDTYFRDVEMQAVASKFAKLYNSYNPPRRVEFLDAWILQLIPASSGVDDDNLTMRGTICGVEPYIAGEYHKHNNNFGYVSELERNTPQAFSHFTYEASGQQMLIVDIQGVSDHYTDPQIHTRSGKEFGKGNLATRGFERFLASHRCNPICRYLKLPLSNPKDEDSLHSSTQSGSTNDGRGTVPAQTYMSQPSVRVRRVDSELCHYYGDSKAFKQYQAKHHQHHHESQDDATSAFVTALKEQRNCSSFCGVGLCTIS